jgi:hypothetical protein
MTGSTVQTVEETVHRNYFVNPPSNAFAVKSSDQDLNPG